MRRKLLAVLVVVLAAGWVLGAPPASADTWEAGNEVPAGGVLDSYPWNGAYPCGLFWVAIDLQVYLKPGVSLVGRWETATGDAGKPVYMTRDASLPGTWVRLNAQTSSAAVLGGLGIWPAGGRAAFHIWSTSDAFHPPPLETFDVKEVRVYGEKDPAGAEYCAPTGDAGGPGTVRTPPPINGGSTPPPGATPPPQQNDPPGQPWPSGATQPPSPSPSASPSPPPPLVICTTVVNPQGIPVEVCFPVDEQPTPSPTPSPSPSAPAPTCVDLMQPQTVQLRLNTTPLVSFTGAGMAGLPLCTYSIGPAGSEQWDWQVRFRFNKAGYQNLGSGTLTTLSTGWVHGYYVGGEPTTGCSGSPNIDTGSFTGLDTMTVGANYYNTWDDYAPSIACSDGGAARWIQPTLTIGGSCSGTCDIVTGTLQLEWQMPGGLPTPAPTAPPTASPTTGPSPSSSAGPSPSPRPSPGQPGGGGTGENGTPPPGPAGGGGIQQPGTGTGTTGENPGGPGGMGSPLGGEVPGGCEATYPKPGQVAYSNPPAVPFPGLSVNPIDWFNWIGSILNVIPTTFHNAIAWLWNGLVDLVMPSTCFGPALEAYLTAVGQEPPFVWFVSVLDSITASLGGGAGVTVPDLTIAGATVDTSSVIGSAMGGLAPFRGFFVAGVYLVAAFAVIRWVGSIVGLRGGGGDAD